MNPKQKSQTHSRSVSSRSQHCLKNITFQTILKRRNETIPASQLYQTNTKSERTLSQSLILHPKEPQTPPQKQLDIRQYVKKMGAKKPISEATPKEVKKQSSNAPCPLERTARSSESVHNASGKEAKGPDNEPKKTIEELQSKIESLLFGSMQLLRGQKNSIGLSKWSQLRRTSTLDQDFQQITEYFQELKVQAEQNDGLAQKLTNLNKRIELLQKMLASESTEADILKHQYYNWKNQRGNTSSFSSKQLLREAPKLNRQKKGTFDTRRQTCSQPGKTKEAVTRFNSTSKIFFKKPSREYYVSPKHKNNSYIVDRQPMPRSSYSAQYLNYGNISTYSYKPDITPTFPEASLAVKASTYQQQYKQKLGLTKAINVNELDCTRDKFKNPDVSFINSSRKNANQGCLPFKKGHKDYTYADSTKENSTLGLNKRGFDSSLIGCMSMSSSCNFFRTEHNKEFVWHNYAEAEEFKSNDEVLKSQIKDKRLQKIKDNFKALAMRN